MTENKLQFNCVTWFHNAFPQHRGMLFEVNNSTNKGASRQGLGMVKGASDMCYCSAAGDFISFELKANNSRHNVEHLERQLFWAQKVQDRGGFSFFIFSVSQFKRIMTSLSEYKDMTIDVYNESVMSKKYIRERIDLAKKNKLKSVALNYNDE